MAKKKAKKSGALGVVAAVLILVVAILTFSMLATPLYKETKTTNNAITGESVKETQLTAYEFMDEMNEETTSIDKDGNEVKSSVIKDVKNMVKFAEEKGISGDDLKNMKANIAVYDTILAVEVLAGVALALGLVALILLALGKGTAGFVFNLIAVLAILAIFVCACIMTSNCNVLCDLMKAEASLGSLAALKIETKTIAPIIVLVVSLLGSLVTGALAVVGRKK